MYKIRGKIIDSNTETIQSKKGDIFEKMYISIEETDTGFHHKHQFEIFGKETINSHKNKIKIDTFVNIDFYIKSNEWKGKFFNTLNIKEITAEETLTKPNTQEVPF